MSEGHHGVSFGDEALAKAYQQLQGMPCSHGRTWAVYCGECVADQKARILETEDLKKRYEKRLTQIENQYSTLEARIANLESAE